MMATIENQEGSKSTNASFRSLLIIAREAVAVSFKKSQHFYFYSYSGYKGKRGG